MKKRKGIEEQHAWRIQYSIITTATRLPSHVIEQHRSLSDNKTRSPQDFIIEYCLRKACIV